MGGQPSPAGVRGEPPRWTPGPAHERPRRVDPEGTQLTPTGLVLIGPVAVERTPDHEGLARAGGVERVVGVSELAVAAKRGRVRADRLDRGSPGRSDHERQGQNPTSGARLPHLPPPFQGSVGSAGRPGTSERTWRK